MPKTKSISFPADADTMKQLKELQAAAQPGCPRSRTDVIREAIAESHLRLRAGKHWREVKP